MPPHEDRLRLVHSSGARTLGLGPVLKSKLTGYAFVYANCSTKPEVQLKESTTSRARKEDNVSLPTP